MIFLFSTIAVLFVLSGVYVLATNRKKQLYHVIYGKDPSMKIRLPVSLSGLPRHLIFGLCFFFAGWFLVGGMLWGFVFLLIGLFMPLLMKGEREKKQVRKMEAQLEEVLYQGTNVLRGGGGLYQFMEYLASDKTPEPLYSIFHPAFLSIQELGTSPIDALKKAAKANPDLSDLGMMASSLEEAERNGADLAEVVEMFASDLRNRRMLQQEIVAKTTQGVFTANFLLGIGVGVPAMLQLFGKVSGSPTIATGSSLLIEVMTAVCYMMMIGGYLIIRRMAQV